MKRTAGFTIHRLKDGTYDVVSDMDGCDQYHNFPSLEMALAYVGTFFLAIEDGDKYYEAA